MEDRKRWNAANKSGADPFDDCGPAAHLAEPSRRALQASYGRFLGFLASKYPHLLDRPPETRLDRKIVAKYVAFRRQSCSESGIAIDLHHLRLALGFICPATNWTWLAIITKRIASKAKRKPQKHHLVTSERLYALGIKLMDRAVESATNAADVSKADAFDYRDGLMLALLARVPLRRRTLAALRIGQQLVKSGDLWGSTFRRRTSKPGVHSTTRSRLTFRGASIYTWQNSAAAFPVQLSTMGFGPPRKVASWAAGRFMILFAVAPVRLLAFQSIYIAFATPLGPFGQSTTLPMCEVSKTCSATHPSR